MFESWFWLWKAVCKVHIDLKRKWDIARVVPGTWKALSRLFPLLLLLFLDKLQSCTAVPATIATSPHQLPPWAPANLPNYVLPVSESSWPLQDLSCFGYCGLPPLHWMLFGFDIRAPTLVVFLIHDSFPFQWHHSPPFIPPFRALPVPADRVFNVLFSSSTALCMDHGFIYPSIFTTLHSPYLLLDQLIGLSSNYICVCIYIWYIYIHI